MNTMNIIACPMCRFSGSFGLIDYELKRCKFQHEDELKPFMIKLYMYYMHKRPILSASLRILYLNEAKLKFSGVRSTP